MEKDFESLLTKSLTQEEAVEKLFGSSEKFAVAQLIAEQDMILSGSSLLKFCLGLIDPKLNLNEYFTDGQRILKGQNILQFDGNLISILKLKKKALKLLEFFSSLATGVQKQVNICKNLQIKVINRVQGFPGYEIWFEKALEDGGTQIYPPELKDSFFMDWNFHYMAGGLEKAVENFRCHNSKARPLSVEIKNTEELKTSTELKVRHIRFKADVLPSIHNASSLIPKDTKTEIIGPISPEKLTDLKELKVDFISLETLSPHLFSPVKLDLVFD